MSPAYPRAASATTTTVWRSRALALTMLLGIASGTALTATARLLAEPANTRAFQGGEEGAGVALVRRFYAAANELLSSRNAAALDALLAPGFVAHGDDGDDRGREELIHELMALGEAFPGVRLVVDRVEAAGTDEVVAHVELERAAVGSFLGLPLSATLSDWGPVEVWRLHEGGIAERWGGSSRRIRMALLWRASRGLQATAAPRGVRLSRLILPPKGHEIIAVAAADRAIVVESGRVALRPGPPDLTATGRVVVIPADAPISVRNDADEPASIIILEAGSAIGGSAVSANLPALDLVVTRESTHKDALADSILMSIPAAAMPDGEFVALGRLELAPGTSLSLGASTRTVALGVESGHLRLTMEGGGAWAVLPDGRLWAFDDLTMTHGDAAVLTTGTGGLWRVVGDEPVSVFILQIDPAIPD